MLGKSHFSINNRSTLYKIYIRCSQPVARGPKVARKAPRNGPPRLKECLQNISEELQNLAL